MLGGSHVEVLEGKEEKDEEREEEEEEVGKMCFLSLSQSSICSRCVLNTLLSASIFNLRP